MTWQNSLFSGITVGKALYVSALSTDARMAVATAAEYSHYRRGWLDSGDVKRIKKSERGRGGTREPWVFQDAKLMFKETTTWPWQKTL